ncbi:M48 family metallopeptidase [Geofilum sp. OHC36d9]|uniref:M48 family metallopeptidase n=1 Tax=Geofilum sp. OHC36d9 TaxID=3458413 RepID=UPI0040334627
MSDVCIRVLKPFINPFHFLSANLLKTLSLINCFNHYMKRSDLFETELEGIGVVTFRSDKRCRRLSLRVKPIKGVEVLFPPGYPIKTAMAFVVQQKTWILQSLQKMKSYEEKLTVFDESTAFRSRSFVLRISKAQRSDVRLFLNNGYLDVFYPMHRKVTEDSIQEVIRYGIEEAMRREAKRFLVPRLAELARQFGFSYNRVFIKNLKSRWGSCSSVNNINLNLHLMRLPESLSDYVLLHELCHTVEKNHGPDFWRLLDRCTNGCARQKAREMKSYRTTIY